MMPTNTVPMTDAASQGGPERLIDCSTIKRTCRTCTPTSTSPTSCSKPFGLITAMPPSGAQMPAATPSSRDRVTLRMPRQADRPADPGHATDDRAGTRRRTERRWPGCRRP